MKDNARFDAEKSKTVRKVATASFFCNFIEWFDYATYSYFAVVIAQMFFPNDDPALALIQTFAVFALSFLLRPIGAIFWGNMGDKKGRKWSLTVSVFMMAGATFCIGLLPGYAALGICAPALLLLLRMIQGFSASGEYAGAATFLAEYAPTDKRGMYCSIVPASTAIGLLVGSAFATVMYTIMPEAAVNEWGWRIPFILAGPLGIGAYFVNIQLEDSPTYQAMQRALKDAEASGAAGAPERPIHCLFTKHLRKLIISIGAAMLNAVGFYVVLTYLPVYLETAVMMPKNEASLITTIALITYVAFIFASGHLSDKFGRKKMLITACVCFIVFTIPAFILMSTANFVTVLVVELIMCLILTINDGTLSSYLSETFPTQVRYSGFALSFNMANALFGGTASFICTSLITATGSTLAPAFYMVAVSCVALVAMIMSHEHSNKDLSEI